MRYYFHLESETNVHIDHLGKEFSEPPGVEAHAQAVALKLAREGKWSGWNVRVINADNREVMCIPIVEEARTR